jgi:Protein of unknown function (DUF3047)
MPMPSSTASFTTPIASISPAKVSDADAPDRSQGIDHRPATLPKIYCQQGARQPGDIISERRATSSRNQRATSSASAAYPMLAWRWYIELPIRSPLDERTREGDDHPARLFLRFVTDRGEKRAMEVIWSNRLKPGEYKYIGDFPHFVADAGDDRAGRWLDERIDLARVYSEIWKDAAPAHLVDIAVFCDSDDTHTASISYFDYVRLEKR